MSLPLVVPLQGFVGIFESIRAGDIEQKAILLDVTFGLKRLVTTLDRVEQIIYLGDLFKMEDYVYHVFKGHVYLDHIKQMYIEVRKYV